MGVRILLLVSAFFAFLFFIYFCPFTSRFQHRFFIWDTDRIKSLYWNSTPPRSTLSSFASSSTYAIIFSSLLLLTHTNVKLLFSSSFQEVTHHSNKQCLFDVTLPTANLSSSPSLPPPSHSFYSLPPPNTHTGLLFPEATNPINSLVAKNNPFRLPSFFFLIFLLSYSLFTYFYFSVGMLIQYSNNSVNIL